MRVVVHGTLAELRASGLLDLENAEMPPCFLLVNLRLHHDPYSDAYRLHADVLNPHHRKEAP
ncbi:hypothetical protein GCM10017673_43180 [Streptosporangium violaceochromogenes]|nr:hypothetical protein GCM10017673_43180 [Streptosporangium violaceochromogenes]